MGRNDGKIGLPCSSVQSSVVQRRLDLDLDLDLGLHRVGTGTVPGAANAANCSQLTGWCKYC